MSSYRVVPVGAVRRRDAEQPNAECVIRVRPELEPALLGIEPGSRLQILYWMHGLGEADREILQCHPRGDRSRPKRGVFALRSPMRPNPIGVTEVEVVAVHGNELTVTGLDALDGSPVVDIKVAP